MSHYQLALLSVLPDVALEYRIGDIRMYGQGLSFTEWIHCRETMPNTWSRLTNETLLFTTLRFIQKVHEAPPCDAGASQP